MQIISVDYHDNSAFRCGRIQNTDKPEFVKLKQFAKDARGIKAMDAWIRECSANPSEILIGVIVEDAQGASLAYHFHQYGYAINPLSTLSVAKFVRSARDKRTLAEFIAQKTVTSKDRWKPLNDVCLEMRAALLEREQARLGCLHNLEKNQAFQSDASLNFLFKLTQNAANIHADRMVELENAIRKTSKKDEFKKDIQRVMTIPCMDDITAAGLVYFMHAYDVKNAEAFGSLLCLHDKTNIRRDNYRHAELKAVRNDLYHMAIRMKDALPEAQKLAQKLAGKPEKIVLMAIAHHVAMIAFAMVDKKRDYKG